METVNGQTRPVQQPLNIDGEVLLFNNYVNYEIAPAALDVCVDLKHRLNK